MGPALTRDRGMKRKRSGRPWQIGVLALAALIAKVVSAPRSVERIERIDVHFIQPPPQLAEEHFAIVREGEDFMLQEHAPQERGVPVPRPLTKDQVRTLVEALEDESGSQLIVSDVIYNRIDPHALRRMMTSPPADTPCNPAQWLAGVTAELDPQVAGTTLFRMTAYTVDTSAPSPWLEVQLHESGEPTQIWWSVSPKPFMQPWTSGAAAGVIDPRRRTAAAPRWSLGAGDALRNLLPQDSLVVSQLGLGTAAEDLKAHITESVSARCMAAGRSA